MITINVHVDADSREPKAYSFTEVEGFSFYSGRDNNTHKPVAQFIDDNPSEEWVNLDPSMLVIDSVDLFDGALCAYARSK